MIEIEPATLKQARNSTLLVAGVLALISAYQLYRGRSTAAYVLGGTVALLLVCAAIPAAARFFHKWWMTLAAALGYVNSRILLGILFYAVITPIGLMARLFGHDPLDRRGGRAASYWHPRARTRQTRSDFERAF